MAEKVGIRFKACGKMYYFESTGIDLRKEDTVVVESSFGMTIGRVVTAVLPVENEERELKKIIRKATEEDIKNKKDNSELEREARAFCMERIQARGLEMKLVCTESTLDKKRIIFYFTADGRIDFRELVKDLASRFRTRIEMRQIGVRDETKLIGGLGVCGREVCCRTFLTGFAPISIKMAKKQELVLNTSKLSGLCGRLMCCLNYEGEESARKDAEPGVTEAVIFEEEYTSLTEPELVDTVPAEPVRAEAGSQERKKEEFRPRNERRERRRDERRPGRDDRQRAGRDEYGRTAGPSQSNAVAEKTPVTQSSDERAQVQVQPGQPQGANQGDNTHKKNRRFHRHRRKKKKNNGGNNPQ